MTDTNAALQAEELPAEEIQAEEAPVEPTEEAPVNDESNEGEPEGKVAFDEKQQEIFDREIGKKVGQTRAAERRAEEAERKLAEIDANKPIEERPAVPAAPDPFAKDFDDLTETRDKAIADAAAFDARQEALRTQQADLEDQAAQERMNGLQTAVQTYSTRATALGISQDDLQKAGDVVAANGINDAVALHILQDEKGPAITTYLAKNPLAMDALHGLNPMQAAAHLEAVVKPNALKNIKTTNAPPPSTNLDGGGSPPSERGPQGATFK